MKHKHSKPQVQKRKKGISRPRFQGKRLESLDQDEDNVNEQSDSSVEEASKKRPKRLEDLHEDDENGDDEATETMNESHYSLLMKSMAMGAEPPGIGSELASQSESQRAESNADGSDEDHEKGSDFDDPDDEADSGHEETVDDVNNSDSDMEDGNGDANDPFVAHFEAAHEDGVAKRLQAIKQSSWTTVKTVTQVSKAILMVPSQGEQSASHAAGGSTSRDSCGRPNVLVNPIRDPSMLKLKQKLREGVGSAKFNNDEQIVASLLFNYYDVLFCKRNHINGPKLRKLVCLHALNHCLVTRDRVMKHSDKINRGTANSIDYDFRDQGFTRPKVLFLLPTRESCARAVHTLVKLLGDMDTENKKRFEESFVDKEKKFKQDRPADFCELFEGNNDDNFRIGIKLTRKTIKLYSPFYTSDLILASPLGLRLAMEGDKKKGKEPDHQFLSSIELVVVDQAEALLMQNWEHTQHIFAHLNRMPETTSDWDFSRVRPWYLQRQARYYRQTVVLSAFHTPELAELQRLHSLNWQGRCRIQPPSYAGELHKAGVKVRQRFVRFDSPSVAGDPDARFNYFVATVIPSLVKKTRRGTVVKANSSGTLIFIPSYLDFVRVRRWFESSPSVASVSFGPISEYDEVSEVSRTKSHFLTGRHKVLLYSGRLHHFSRSVLRGVKRIIMYALPDNPLYYREVVGYLANSLTDGRLRTAANGEVVGADDEADGEDDVAAAAMPRAPVRVLFSRYDMLRLERVVGSTRVGKMLMDKGDVFDFL